MRRLRCLFRRHDWHSDYDDETKSTTLECRRCGATKRGNPPGSLLAGDSGPVFPGSSM